MQAGLRAFAKLPAIAGAGPDQLDAKSGSCKRRSGQLPCPSGTSSRRLVMVFVLELN